MSLGLLSHDLPRLSPAIRRMYEVAAPDPPPRSLRL
jgi:hypothetical protein